MFSEISQRAYNIIPSIGISVSITQASKYLQSNGSTGFGISQGMMMVGQIKTAERSNRVQLMVLGTRKNTP